MQILIVQFWFHILGQRFTLCQLCIVGLATTVELCACSQHVSLQLSSDTTFCLLLLDRNSFGSSVFLQPTINMSWHSWSSASWGPTDWSQSSKAGIMMILGTIPSMATSSRGILKSVLPPIKSPRLPPRKPVPSYLCVRTGHAVHPASLGSSPQVSLNHPPFPLRHGLKLQVFMTPTMLHADNCLTRFKAQRGPERLD